MIIHKYPTKYIVVTQEFNEVYKGKKHNGVDIGWSSKYGGKNCPIYASADGEVLLVNDNDKTGESWGNYVKLKHSSKEYTMYGHLKNGAVVKKGQKVKQGDLIGYMGNTGYSFGEHLHFEIYKGGASTKYRVDPCLYTYAFPDQVVERGTRTDRNVKYYTPITPVVEKDETKNQLQTNFKINVRKGAGTNFDSLGEVSKGNIYNYDLIVKNEDYTWYRIAEDQYLAQDKNETYLTIMPAKEETKPTIDNTNIETEELKQQIDNLNKSNIELQDKVNLLTKECEELRAELINYEDLRKFTTPEDGIYKIPLLKGEELYKK